MQLVDPEHPPAYARGCSATKQYLAEDGLLYGVSGFLRSKRSGDIVSQEDGFVALLVVERYVYSIFP